MRLFFGLEPDAACKAAIADWRDRFALSDGRPVPAGNFHITLAFLGDVEERQLEALCSAADALDPGPWPGGLSLRLDRVGFWSSPGIYWLGPSAPVAPLEHLATKLQTLGQRFGARRERRAYTPHVTLYRRCSAPPPSPIVAPALDARFEGFQLFESRRERHGVRYEPVAGWSMAR